jgi:hypothetical protein
MGDVHPLLRALNPVSRVKDILRKTAYDFAPSRGVY